jgi:hypothetical protein
MRIEMESNDIPNTWGLRWCGREMIRRRRQGAHYGLIRLLWSQFFSGVSRTILSLAVSDGQGSFFI